MKIWPFNLFKKRRNSSTDSFASNKSPKSSIVSILGAFFAAFLILSAGATSVGIAAWKEKQGSEFTNSYNIRFELSPYDEQDFAYESKIRGNYDDLAKQSADAYSQFLHKKGLDDINVFPEWIPDENAPTDHGKGRIFINAIIPNQYYYDKVEEADISEPKSSIYMDYVNSSRLTAIVQVDKGTNRQFAVIPLNQYFSSKPKVNSKNPLEVDVKLNTSFSNIVDQYFDTTTSSTAGVNDDATNNSQIYIVQNYYELLNYLTYLIQTNVDASITGSNAESVSVFNYLKQNFNGENTFVDAYDKDHNIKTNDNALLTDSEFNKGDNGYHYYQVSDNGNVLIVNGDAADEGANNFFTDAPLYFESKRNDDSGGKWEPTGQINYNFLKKYVLAFGQPDKKDTQISDISGNSFLKIIPNKNPTNTKEDSNWQWLTINTTSRYQAQNIVSAANDFTFPLPVKSLTVEPFSRELTNNDCIYTNILNNTNEVKQTFNSTIFGFQPIIGLILALSLIILSIGIIVSLLYRIPGIFAFLSIFASFGLTLMILVLSKYTLSIAMFIGLLIGILGSTISSFSWCSRIKKLYCSGMIFDVAIRKGIKRGFLPVLDIHAILLIVGIGISYFGANQIYTFGNALFIFSIISFGFTVLAWMILVLLLFNNKIGFTKLKWFFEGKQESAPKVIPNKNYETVYGGKFESKRFSLFGWKQILGLIMLIIVATLGVILIITVGVHSSYVFYGGSRLIVAKEAYDTHTAAFAGYSNITMETNGFFVYLYYDHVFDTNQISTWADFSPNYTPSLAADWVSVQSISSAGAISFANSAIYLLLIISGLISVYAFVRLNWVSVLPIFAGLLLTPMLCVGVIVICQIYFDIYVILSIITVYAINAIFVIHLVSILNNQWVRKQIFTRQELTKIFNTEIKNSLLFYLWIYGIVIGAFLLMLIFNSTTLIWFNLVVIIGVLSSIGIMCYLIPFLLKIFIQIRYRYLSSSSVDRGTVLHKNYDSIDEQLIDGINKFKRKMPVV